jgi:succinate-semialdehyde dehydrogenase/glutarate-semialdehyde dehydrogenase
MIDHGQRQRVGRLVGAALAESARLVTGGRPVEWPRILLRARRPGWRLPGGCRRSETELFGPVAPIATIATDVEALSLANDSHYGLAAYLYTRDISRAVRLSEELEVGMVRLNQGIVSTRPRPSVASSRPATDGREAGKGSRSICQRSTSGWAP